MPLDPTNDPNEAYEVGEADQRGWWPVMCNGIPVRYFNPDRKDLAEKYISDPEYRKSLVKKKLWEK